MNAMLGMTEKFALLLKLKSTTWPDSIIAYTIQNVQKIILCKYAKHDIVLSCQPILLDKNYNILLSCKIRKCSCAMQFERGFIWYLSVPGKIFLFAHILL